jgi:signal transduction histidine kinase
MRERAAQVGGDVELASAPGQGTRVTARVPIAERPAQA